MEPRRFETIVFDFDYTLADSSKGVIDCISFALARLGLPAARDEEVCATIGLPLELAFQTLAGRDHRGRFEEFFRLFIERAEVVMADATAILEPVPETVTALRRQGMTLGIVSTKFRYRIEAILEREELRNSFDVIIGGEDVAALKPDPEGLLMAIQRVRSSPRRCLYVGDSVIDAETSKRAGVAFAAVLSGVTPRERFAEYDGCQILGSLSELPALVTR